MSINFFEELCQSKTHSPKFGLCDDPDEPQKPAYINEDNKDEKWIAIVTNNKKVEVTFTAIDNCIEIKTADGNMDNRCDGMLTYENCIILVELKERRKDWIEEGENQLKKTINSFIANNNMEKYKRKIAYIANRKRPNFQYSQKIKMQEFSNETGFRLLIQNSIKISKS